MGILCFFFLIIKLISSLIVCLLGFPKLLKIVIQLTSEGLIFLTFIFYEKVRDGLRNSCAIFLWYSSIRCSDISWHANLWENTYLFHGTTGNRDWLLGDFSQDSFVQQQIDKSQSSLADNLNLQTALRMASLRRTLFELTFLTRHLLVASCMLYPSSWCWLFKRVWL